MDVREGGRSRGGHKGGGGDAGHHRWMCGRGGGEGGVIRGEGAMRVTGRLWALRHPGEPRTWGGESKRRR